MSETEWSAKANLKTYGEAVAEAMTKAGKSAEAVKAWTKESLSLSNAQARAKAASLGFGGVFWDWDAPRPREGYFRASDHQMMHEMYTITALPAAQVKNQWDLFTSSPAVPGANESLEVIATQGDEAVCKFS